MREGVRVDVEAPTSTPDSTLLAEPEVLKHRFDGVPKREEVDVPAVDTFVDAVQIERSEQRIEQCVRVYEPLGGDVVPPNDRWIV